MQWNKKDLEQYLEVTEYVDTLLVPLMPVTLNTEKDAIKLATQAELLEIFSNELERYFSGRIFLAPSYNYLHTQEKEMDVQRINALVEEAKVNPFTHVFFLSFDHHWKKYEAKLDGTLIWLPAMLTGDVRSKDAQSIIKEQISQVTDLIKSYW